MSTITAPEATPTIVTVHYLRDDGSPAFMSGALTDEQPDDGPRLVPNARAWRDPGVCTWGIPWRHVTRVEVHQVAYEPTPADLIAAELAALALTPWERIVLDSLEAIGKPVQWRDIPDIVRYLHGHEEIEERIIRDVLLQSLKAKGYIRLVNSPGLTSGVVHLT